MEGDKNIITMQSGDQVYRAENVSASLVVYRTGDTIYVHPYGHAEEIAELVGPLLNTLIQRGIIEGTTLEL